MLCGTMRIRQFWARSGIVSCGLLLLGGCSQWDISEEGRVPRTLRGPGTPSQDDVGRQSTTRIPYRSWCVQRLCQLEHGTVIAGRHRFRGRIERQTREVFEYAFLWAEGGRELWRYS